MDQEVRLRAATYGIPPIVHMVQGDNGRSLKMILEDFEVEDYYDCVVAVHRPDDSYYEIGGLAIPAGNYVSAPAYQAITRPGKVECQLKISMPGMLISTFDFVIMVHESVVGLPVEQLGYDIYDLIDAASQISGTVLTDDIKQALLDCFEHVAWTDENGQDYVDALEEALYPPAELASISAVYTQSGTVYTTDTLDSLKANLVVTAHYTDSTAETVTTYTLSGTLTEGTSVITVTYEGKTTTFNVTVTAPATLSSITAVYTQSSTVYDTDSLDSLKSDLVVTAVYSDSTTETVASTDYTLSGTLAEGTSTITVSYGGKTTTFTVTVSVYTKTAIYDWDLKSSLTDTVGGITASTTATFTSGTGLVFGNSHYCDFGAIYELDRTYELDVVNHNQTALDNYGRLFMVDIDANTGSGGSGFIFTGSKKLEQYPTGYGIYTGSAWDSQTFANIGTGTSANSYNNGFFDGKTIKFYIASDGKCSVSYKTTGAADSTYVFLGTSVDAFNSYTNGHVYIGGTVMDYLYTTTISGLRVYEGEV